MARRHPTPPSDGLHLGPTVTMVLPRGAAALTVGTVYVVAWSDGTRQPVRILSCAAPHDDGRVTVQALLLPREADHG